MLNPSTLQALRDKWGFKDDSLRSSFSAIVMDNQIKHFQRLSEDVKDKTKLNEDFIRNLVEAMRAQLRTHPLVDLCSMQPMTGPIGLVHWYRRSQTDLDVTGGVPEIRLDIKSQEICAHSRRLKAFFNNASSEGLEEMWNSPATINMVVEEALTEVARELLGTMLNSCEDEQHRRVDVVPAEGDLLKQLQLTANNVHRETQRAPANRVVGNEQMLSELGVDVPISNGQVQDLGVWNDRYHIYFDPLFPADKLMAWYQGPSTLDTGLIFSPYIMFMLTPVSIDPPKDMCVDMAIRMRHKITMVNPAYFRLIER
jgi:hypothetical protein